MTRSIRTASAAGIILIAIASTAGCGSNQATVLTREPAQGTAFTLPEAYTATKTPASNPIANPTPSDAQTAAYTVSETPASTDESHWNVVSLAAGGNHTCAVVGDIEFNEGFVRCWGNNDFGQLDDKTSTDSNTPVDLYWGGAAGLFRAVVAGWGHSCAFGNFLDEPPGGVKCWGYNKNGELGNGHNIHSYLSEYQVRVWGLYDVVALAAGDNHTCALLGSGGVKCWGYNEYGQLGDGTTNNSNTPVDVEFLSGGVVAIAAGWGYTCALIQDGGVRCWGSNQFGQLGDGTDVPYRNVRGVVAGLENDIVGISAGGAHTCALKKNNQVRCWGQNNYGQLGDGTAKDRNLPVLAMVQRRIDDNVLQLASGRYHTCALMNLGRVRCWGNNQFGQLGDGTNLTSTTAIDVDISGVEITTIAAGWGHTCASTNKGEILCWGKNEFGQLGNGTNTDSTTPVEVIGLYDWVE
jgi:alpha-tubulin suppressor-like RCC1 family protein